MTKKKVLQQQQQQRPRQYPDMPPQVAQPHEDIRKLAAQCGAEEYLYGPLHHQRLVIEFTPAQLATFTAHIREGWIGDDEKKA